MANDTLNDKISAYLTGRLSSQEAQQFETDMSLDPALAEEVELQRLEEEAMDELFRQHIERQIPGWLDSLDDLPAPPAAPPAPVKTRVSTDALLWAFGLIALLSLAGAFWLWREVVAGRKKAAELELRLQNAQMEKEAAQNKVKILEDSLKLQPAAPTRPTALPAPKPIEAVEQPTPDLLALVDTDAIESLCNLLASAGLSNKSSESVSETAQKRFKTAQEEFCKKGRRNDRLIKSELLLIAPEEKIYPYAQAMLSGVYFKEKDYRRALESFEKYAAQDKSPDGQWLLLNFRLAAYPYQKTEFLDLLDRFSQKSGFYQAKANALHTKLQSMGIVK